MASAAVCSKVVVLLLLVYGRLLPLIVGVFGTGFVTQDFTVLSSFTIILKRKRELVALL